MILEMYMKNCALIEECRLNINNGLNILTGETGAGKTLIVDSLRNYSRRKIFKRDDKKRPNKLICRTMSVPS